MWVPLHCRSSRHSEECLRPRLKHQIRVHRIPPDRPDGNDTTDSINGNCANTPVEVFETHFAFQIEEYAMREDSGGAGKRRGGLSTKRALIANDDVVISQSTIKFRRGGLTAEKPGRSARRFSGAQARRNGTPYRRLSTRFPQANFATCLSR